MPFVPLTDRSVRRSAPMKTPFSLLFRHAWQRIEPLFAGIDRALIAFATLFGTSVTSRSRHASTLLVVYAAIYALSFVPVPAISIAVLILGCLGVLAIGRAWVANEKLRTRIVKKLANADPDELPDLRRTAL